MPPSRLLNLLKSKKMRRRNPKRSSIQKDQMSKLKRKWILTKIKKKSMTEQTRLK